MSTLAVPFHLEKEFSDPNQVKVVIGHHGNALYFSRSAIPYDRDAQREWHSLTEMTRPLKHLGMYGYKKAFLETFAQSEPGQLESLEKLEQLRALEMGFRIAVRIVEEPTLGIDQPNDLEAFKSLLI
jgi:3-deoxy-manno-octulosonate cytidylyltransferase (CMP-KDO synthetase)